MRRRVYSYVRFSSPEQSEGDSYRRQTEYCQRYAEKHGLVLDESLTIRDLGVSAFRGANLKTGALAEFVRAVSEKRVPSGSVLVLESLDRFSRGGVHGSVYLFLQLLLAGITVVTTIPEREYRPGDENLLSVMESSMLFSRANEESATKSARIAASWEARRREAATDGTPMTPVCPAWCELVDGKYRLVPERSRTVKKVFQWCRDGLGTFAIVKRLRKEEIQPFGRSKNWNTAYVRLLLTDRRALGEYQLKKLVYDYKRSADDQKQEFMVPVGEPVSNYYPAVVSETEFYAAASQIKSRRKRGGRGGTENLLKGLVWNADDGAKMYIAKQRNGVYLDSTAGYYGSEAAKGRSFRYQPIEDCVLSMLTELTPELVLGTPGEDPAKEKVEELKGRLDEVNNKLETVTEKARNTADVTVYLDLIARLNADQKRITGELEEAKTKAAQQGSGIGETQALIGLLRTTKGAERERIRQRLQQCVFELVESVWVRIQLITRNKKIAHVALYLRSDEKRYRVVYFPEPRPGQPIPKPLNYAKTDFRAGWSDK